MSRHTVICKFGNKKMKNLKDGFSTIISVPTARVKRDHNLLPMQKRIELPAKFIEHYTNEDEIILDIFGHSGSTLMACQQLRRICYINEIEPKYCQAIINRFKAFYPEILIEKI